MDKSPEARLPASYYEPVPKNAYRIPPTSGWHGWIPGFRSAIWWKALIATPFYLLCLLGIGVGLASLNLSLTTFYIAAVAIPVAAIQLVRFRHVRVVNLALIGGLVLALAAGGVSIATAPPSPDTSTALKPVSSPATEKPAAIPATPTPAATASPTPLLTPSPSPKLAPSPTPVVVVPPAPRPSPHPSPRPPPPPRNLCGAPSNPWNYNLCGGAVITSPPSSFCSYFPCIPSFWTNTNGYVELCSDGQYSHSGGVSGSCSHHGGNRQPLYR